MTAFLRLYWKEYRAQRPLWLVLATCAALLPIVIAAISDSRESWTVVSVFVSICICGYAAASPALLFAGEEDMGTAVWLRQLPVSTRCLFWSKFAASVTGILFLVLVAAVPLLLLLLLLRRPAEHAVYDALHVAAVVFGLFLASLFWSLRCRSVFRTLGLAAATTIIVGIMVQQVSEPIMAGVVVATLLLAVGAVLRQSGRWHLGLRETGPSRQTRTSQVSSDMVSGVASEIGATEDPGIWSRRLQQAAIKPTELRRTCSVLLWRELRFAVPFFSVAMVLGIGAVTWRLLNTPDQVPLALLLLFALVLECGLRTFRHDQQKLHGLFWSHRGVSPLLAWGARNVVWLGTLLLTAGALLLIDLPYLESSSHRDFHGRIIDVVTQAIHVPGSDLDFRGPDGRQVIRADWQDRSLQLSVSMAWLMGGFFVTQLCSCWFRKPLIAGFLGLVALGTYTWFVGYSVALDIPMVLSAWPVAFIALLAVLFSRRSWMDRRLTLQIALRRAVLFVVPLLCLWPVHAAWRVLQVPPHRAPLTLSPEQFGYAESNTTTPWALEWERLSLALQPLEARADATEAPTVLDDVLLERALTSVDRILQYELYAKHLPPSLRVPWAKFPAQPLTFAIEQVTKKLHGQQQAAEAMRRLMDGLTLLRYLQNEATSWDQWLSSLRYQQMLLQHMHWICSDDALTAEELRSFADAVTVAAPQQPGDFRPFHQNRMVVYSQLLERRGYLWDEYQRLQEKSDFATYAAGWPDDVIQASYSERQRFLRLLRVSADLPLPGGEGAGHYDRGQSFHRWAATTPSIGTDLNTDVAMHSPLAAVWWHDDSFGWGQEEQTRVAIEATFVVLQLQAYRREHGRFPEHLGQLPLRNGVEFEFAYAPHGLGTNFIGGHPYFGTALIHQSQPLLTTRKANAAALARSARSKDQRPVQDTLPMLEADPARIVFLNGTSTPVIVSGTVADWIRDDRTGTWFLKPRLAPK